MDKQTNEELRKYLNLILYFFNLSILFFVVIPLAHKNFFNDEIFRYILSMGFIICVNLVIATMSHRTNE